MVEAKIGDYVKIIKNRCHMGINYKVDEIYPIIRINNNESYTVKSPSETSFVLYHSRKNKSENECILITKQNIYEIW